MADEVKYRGVPLFMDGKTYYLPSLSVVQFRESYDALVEPVSGEGKEAISRLYDRLIPIIGKALRRNHPEVTDAQLEAMLDLSTFPRALQIVQSASGLKESKPGEE